LQGGGRRFDPDQLHQPALPDDLEQDASGGPPVTGGRPVASKLSRAESPGSLTTEDSKQKKNVGVKLCDYAFQAV
jgi:hypothetical protein